MITWILYYWSFSYFWNKLSVLMGGSSRPPHLRRLRGPALTHPVIPILTRPHHDRRKKTDMPRPDPLIMPHLLKKFLHHIHIPTFSSWPAACHCRSVSARSACHFRSSFGPGLAQAWPLKISYPSCPGLQYTGLHAPTPWSCWLSRPTNTSCSMECASATPPHPDDPWRYT